MMAWLAWALGALLVLVLVSVYNRLVALADEVAGGARQLALELERLSGADECEVARAERRVAASRRIYNSAVEAFNTAQRPLPARLVAALAGLERRPFLE